MKGAILGALAIVAALAVGAGLIAVLPAMSRLGTEPIDPVSPWTVYGAIASGVASREGASWVLYHAGILMLTALAVAVPLRARRFNIGGEGQLAVGGLAATAAALGLARTADGLPAIAGAALLLAASAAAACAAGAAWGALAAILAGRGTGAHEVISTILLNFVASAGCQYAVLHHLLDQGSGVVQTPPLPAGARIGRLADCPGLGAAFDSHTPLGWMLVVALVAVAATAVVLGRSCWGYEAAATGGNPLAARAAGIAPDRIATSALAMGGGLAGLASLALIHGHHGHFGADVLNGQYGFIGLAVALLGRGRPLGIVPAAILFAVLFQGASEVELATRLPRSFVQILQALSITAIVAAGALGAPRGSAQ